MRIFLGLLVVVAVVGGVMANRRSQPAGPAPAAVASTTASPGAPSQHNWPKSALDRVGDIKRQVKEQRKADDEVR